MCFVCTQFDFNDSPLTRGPSKPNPFGDIVNKCPYKVIAAAHNVCNLIVSGDRTRQTMSPIFL